MVWGEKMGAEMNGWKGWEQKQKPREGEKDHREGVRAMTTAKLASYSR